MKKMISALLVVFAIGSMFSTSSMAVTVRGSPSCGEWVETSKKPDGWPHLANQRWLVGYLSGIATGLEIDFIKKADNASMFLWVDNYCKANPLSYADDAGVKLVMELTKK